MYFFLWSFIFSIYLLPDQIHTGDLKHYMQTLQLIKFYLIKTPTRRRIKSSRDVGELVLNPIQLIRS